MTWPSAIFRTTPGLLDMAIKPNSICFNPAPHECIEPDDCLTAGGEPAQFGPFEAPASFFTKVGLR